MRAESLDPSLGFHSFSKTHVLVLSYQQEEKRSEQTPSKMQTELDFLVLILWLIQAFQWLPILCVCLCGKIVVSCKTIFKKQQGEVSNKSILNIVKSLHYRTICGWASLH